MKFETRKLKNESVFALVGTGLALHGVNNRTPSTVKRRQFRPPSTPSIAYRSTRIRTLPEATQ
jgi:hypothetical protein